MPADRRIVVNVSEPGYRDPALQGEWVPGAVICYRMCGPAVGTSPRSSRYYRAVLVMKQAVTGVFVGILESLALTDGQSTESCGRGGDLSQSPTWSKSRGNDEGEPDLRRRFLDLQGIHG